jgi:hypothetical protein
MPGSPFAPATTCPHMLASCWGTSPDACSRRLKPSYTPNLSNPYPPTTDRCDLTTSIFATGRSNTSARWSDCGRRVSPPNPGIPGRRSSGVSTGTGDGRPGSEDLGCDIHDPRRPGGGAQPAGQNERSRRINRRFGLRETNFVVGSVKAPLNRSGQFSRSAPRYLESFRIVRSRSKGCISAIPEAVTASTCPVMRSQVSTTSDTRGSTANRVSSCEYDDPVNHQKESSS